MGVQRAANFEQCDLQVKLIPLVGACNRAFAILLHITCARGPGPLEVADIAPRNSGSARNSGFPHRVPVGLPVGIGHAIGGRVGSGRVGSG